MKRKLYSLIGLITLVFVLVASAIIFTPGDDLFIGRDSKWGTFGLNLLGDATTPFSILGTDPLQWLDSVFGDNDINDATTNEYDAILSQYSCPTFNGSDEYAVAENTGLGASDFYFEWSGTPRAYLDATERFFWQGTTGSELMAIERAATNVVEFQVNDGGGNSDTFNVTFDTTVASEDMLIKFYRVGSTITGYAQKVSTGESKTNTTTFAHDCSGTNNLYILTKDAVAPNVTMAADMYSFKYGTSSTNITGHHTFQEDNGTVVYDVVGTNHLDIVTSNLSSLWNGTQTNHFYYTLNGGSRSVYQEGGETNSFGLVNSGSTVEVYVNALTTTNAVIGTGNGVSDFYLLITSGSAFVGVDVNTTTGDPLLPTWNKVKCNTTGDLWINDVQVATNSWTHSTTNVLKGYGLGLTELEWAYISNTTDGTNYQWNAYEGYGTTVPSSNGTNLTSVSLVNLPALSSGSDDVASLGILNPADGVFNNDTVVMIQTNSALSNNWYWHTGTNFISKTSADHYGHTNFDSNVVVSAVSASDVDEIISYSYDKFFTETEYSGITNWLSDNGSVVSISSPLTNSAGDFVKDANDKVSFLDPLQWLYDTSAPTNVLDQTTNDVDAVFVDSPLAKFNGTSGYADTGYVATTNTKIEVVGRFLDTSANDYMGSYSAANGTFYEFGMRAGGTWYFSYRDQTTLNAGAADTSEHTFVIDEGVFSVDGVPKQDFSGATGTLPPHSLYICDRNDGVANPIVPCNFELKSYKIYESGVLQTYYTASEGGGAVLYDVVGTNHAPLVSITESTFWGTNQDDNHYAIFNGYSLYEKAGSLDIYVPYGTNGSPLSITPPSGYSKTYDIASVTSLDILHNGAPTSITQVDNTLSNNAFWASQAEVLGDDVATNGGFDTDTDWVKGAGWTISNGTANCASGNVTIYQDMGIEAGKTYRITWDIVNYTSGDMRIVMNGAPNVESGQYSGNGSYSLDIMNATANGNISIQSWFNFIGSIDNVVVKEVIYEAGDFYTKTASNLYNHVNFDNNVVVIGTAVNSIEDILTFDVDKAWTPFDYQRATNWFGSVGSTQTNMVPYEVDSGGIGPGGTWYPVDDVNVYLVVPE